MRGYNAARESGKTVIEAIRDGISKAIRESYIANALSLF